ncbi:MAG TPA: redoxin domain-containing protein [Candidatus Angelobacter sp.]|nr:redoxin domain-containing protein [Candidatus Angelobacter sp.]
MSQAEIAGGAVTPPNEIPSKGRILPDIALPTASLGRQVHTSDFRGRANLVVIADDGQSETANLISEAARQYGEIKSQEAEVLVIVRPLRSTAAAEQKSLAHLPGAVLVDEDGSVRRRLGAVDAQGHDSAAIYVTDRYGEVFGVYRKSDGQSVPDIGEILSWLEFINSQCPECEAPEWPI